MRRLATIAAAMALAAAGLGAAPGGLARWGSLKPGDYMQNLPWGDPGFRRELAAVLAPKAPLARLYRGGPVVGPLRRTGQAVVAWGCRAHNCSDIQAQVYIEPEANRLFVCWRDADASGGSDWWLARGKAPERLPERACAAEERADKVYAERAAR
ncbi:MAG TPA: hypothetical protein VG939_00470 [Caulobacteraceae bacterium]|nr:hypothetical protein [Caulobacteraceae bacterium]